MVKQGFQPKWGHLHSAAVKEFETKKGDQADFSPKFSDFGDVMKWLDEDS